MGGPGENRAIEEGRLNPGEIGNASCLGSLGLANGLFGLERAALVKGWWKAWAAIVGNESQCAASWSLSVWPSHSAPIASPFADWRKSQAALPKNSTARPRALTQLLRALLQRHTVNLEPEGLGPCSKELRNSGDPSAAPWRQGCWRCRFSLGGKAIPADQLPPIRCLQRP